MLTELEVLKVENDSLKNIISQSNAEKLAIDQMLMSKVRDEFLLRSKLILLEEKINKLNVEIIELKIEKSSATDKNVIDICPDSDAA